MQGSRDFELSMRLWHSMMMMVLSAAISTSARPAVCVRVIKQGKVTQLASSSSKVSKVTQRGEHRSAGFEKSVPGDEMRCVLPIYRYIWL